MIIYYNIFLTVYQQRFFEKVFKFTAFIIYTSLIWAKNLEKILRANLLKKLDMAFCEHDGR